MSSYAVEEALFACTSSVGLAESPEESPDAGLAGCTACFAVDLDLE